ncbi:GntR family transcriptional regulator [Sphingomonas histidinilytica]|uniref:GntR family transcriptional regulator n=1 Tax=Rhizorhabdus histidinilytica TaxID=439228 RepID=UPI001ADB6907|nr:GntR family transcriptional regulator [Rhizorhabdus histidinilytica]MBO9375575.1 GntR family transcriptional regulator [Rhizorhabdus histidinilytica]
MSPEAITTERIYALLKADIIRGRYPPRSEIVATTIARECGVSIAPIRDSAQRLIGERLLVPLHGGGFAIPDITEQGLHDLLFWHGQLVRNAVNLHRTSSMHIHVIDYEFNTESPEAMARTAGALFAAIATRAQNDEIAHAVLAAGDRLHAIRVKEAENLRGVGEELRAVQTLTADGPDQDLIQALWAYHRRRLRRIRQLVEAVGGTVGGRTAIE